MTLRQYAVIENNIVVNVVIGDDEWFETQDQSKLVLTNEGDSPSVGGKYLDGVFYKAKPYPSWVESDGGWIPPISKPENIEGFGWMWDEESLSWISLTLSASLGNEELTDEFAD